jgi:hypothetical protein
VLESEPSNPTAKRGMGLLKKGITPDEIQSLSDSGRMERFFPPMPSKLTAAPVIITVLAVLIAFGLAYLGYRIIGSRAPAREGISAIELPTSMLVDTNASGSSYILTERDVSRAFDRAKSYLLSYRDNLAAVQLNRILLSNATAPVKERARALKGFLIKPSFTTFRDGFSYADVAKEPGLYDGASVRWKGSVANLNIGKDKITFDFLVGYEQQKELQGVVPVTLSFAADVKDGMALDLLAQVTVQEGRIGLSGISIHQLILN